ncbi:carbon-nitrogen hydrolase family protein [Ekhidna sp.]
MNVKIAVVQDSPVLLDLKKSLEKVRELSLQASEQKPDLIVFPEAFLPGYPRGLSFGTTVGSRSEEGRSLWLRYSNNSIKIPSESTTALGEIAKECDSHMVIGVVEKSESGTLYCSVLYYDNNGELLGNHRKLKPTGTERVIWGEGDGSDLTTYTTPFGKIGGLICWENYMPLARMHVYQSGVDLYIAPTADQRDSWQATMKHIACEGRCYVIGCNQFATKDDYPTDLKEELVGHDHVLCKGGSVIVDPFGNVVAGPLWGESGILYADIDMDLVKKGKMDFDVIGHYDRKDVFELKKIAAEYIFTSS